MDIEDLCYLRAVDLADLIAHHEVSPVDATTSCLTRITKLEARLNSFITVLAEEALTEAQRAESEIARGHYRGPMHGIPVAVKDLISTKGVRTTSGTKIFDDCRPTFDATVVTKLRNAGAILLGKLNLAQLALGPAGENPDYGDTNNPWDPTYITGGSSGGAASATASFESFVALGTDTGGSVRLPASMCGVVGLKPTNGLVSRHGVTPLSWSQDCVGPLVRGVEDCALVLQTITGFDSHDPNSADPSPVDYRAGIKAAITGIRIGVPKEFFQIPLDDEVASAVTTSLSVFEDLGASVSAVSWPMFPLAPAIGTTILLSEAGAAFGDLVRAKGDEITDPTVRLRLEAGLLMSAEEYLQAQRARSLFVAQSDALFDSVDLLIGPTVPLTATPRGLTALQVGGVTVQVLNAFTPYCRPFNLNGCPAITLPCGFSRKGMPIGLQLAARPFDEAMLLRCAYAYETATSWHEQRPPEA